MTEQLALFSQVIGAPEGLQYAGEFVSPALERELIGHVSALPLQPFQFGAFEGKRRVASFGFRYDYTLQRLQSAEPIPDWLGPLIEKVEAFDGPSTQIAQVLCTEYNVGIGIGWHRYKPHFDRIFGLSLASPCKFRFRRAVGEKWQCYTLEAASRSLTSCRANPDGSGNTAFPPSRRRVTPSPFVRWLTERPSSADLQL